jgi:hypothetical protein
MQFLRCRPAPALPGLDFLEGFPKAFLQGFRERLVAGEFASQLDGQLVGFHVVDARGANPQVPFHQGLVLLRQLSGNEIDEEFYQLLTGHHADTSSK